MHLVLVVVSVLLVLVLVSSCVRKARRATSSEELRQRLGVARRLWLAVGGLELLAAIGLMMGLALAPVGLAAAVGTAVLMLGAVAAHRRVQLGGAALTAPLGVLSLAAAAAALQLQAT